jgi:hypothetical protein
MYLFYIITNIIDYFSTPHKSVSLTAYTCSFLRSNEVPVSWRRSIIQPFSRHFTIHDCDPPSCRLTSHKGALRLSDHFHKSRKHLGCFWNGGETTFSHCLQRRSELSRMRRSQLTVSLRGEGRGGKAFQSVIPWHLFKIIPDISVFLSHRCCQKTVSSLQAVIYYMTRKLLKIW